MKPRLEVCLSPALLHLYDIRESVVVIIDVFRATSTIAAALHNGAERVVPVAAVAECIETGAHIPNSITAGERDGKVAEGLQHGNSPLEYPASFVQGRTLVLTTTNGTRLLHMAKHADTIVTGAFLNLDAVCEYLLQQGKNVLLGCSAWKDRYNLEDSLFAGAVVNRIKHAFDMNCDSARASEHLYLQAKDDLYGYIQDSSHFLRLSKFGLEKDMEYCVTPNLHPVVPVLKGDDLVIA
jgi:2-phosphosulfolactate phosphatase